MASSHDIPLVDRLYAFAAALPLHHLNKPVPHFLLDIHDAMLPHLENMQLSLEERGWASLSLPPYLSTLQARLAIIGLAIALAIIVFAAALPRGKSGGPQKPDGNAPQEAEAEVSAVEEVVGEVGVGKQGIRGEEEVEEVEVEREEQEIKLDTQPVPASPRAVSVTSTSVAAVLEKPIAPVPADATPASPPSVLPTTTPASPVSQKGPGNDVDTRSPRPAPPTGNRFSPIRTRSSTSSIPVRVPTTPARSSSYPTAINTSVNHKRHVSTPIARTATSPTSPASAKVVAASYAWVMSEGLEWDDRAGSSDETGEKSDNSASYSDDDDDDDDHKDGQDNSSPRSRRSLEDELQAAGYAGDLDGDAQYHSESDNDDNDGASDSKKDARAAEQKDNNSSNGALHPRRHSHTSDIEARYEAWRKTRADAGSNGSSSNNKASSPMGSGIGGIGGIASGMGGMRKTRSHHSRKDSVLDSQNNSPSNTGRSSLTMSTRSMTRHALQRKRSSALKPWARKRREDFGEWLKKKTTNTTTTTATSTTKG